MVKPLYPCRHSGWVIVAPARNVWPGEGDMTGMPDDKQYASYQKSLRHKGNDDYDDYAD